MEENRSGIQGQTTYQSPQYDPNRPYGQQPYGQPQQGQQPYGQPIGQPYGQPQQGQQPYGQPTGQPIVHPSGQPYGQPAGQPIVHPSGQPYGQPQQGQQPYGQPPRPAVYDMMSTKNNNTAITGLILGIISLLGFWAPIAGIILSAIGLVCSAIALSRKDPEGRTSGMAVGGLILSIIALILSMIVTVIFYIAMLEIS